MSSYYDEVGTDWEARSHCPSDAYGIVENDCQTSCSYDGHSSWAESVYEREPLSYYPYAPSVYTDDHSYAALIRSWFRFGALHGSSPRWEVGVDEWMGKWCGCNGRKMELMQRKWRKLEDVLMITRKEPMIPNKPSQVLLEQPCYKVK